MTDQNDVAGSAPVERVPAPGQTMATPEAPKSSTEKIFEIQRLLDRNIDVMNPIARLKYYLFNSSDNILYWMGLLLGGYQVATNKGSPFSLLISPAYAQAGWIQLLGQGKNYVATLIFVAFLVSLVGAIFASGPGRTAAETFAKLLAGGLVGFVGGAKM